MMKLIYTFSILSLMSYAFADSHVVKTPPDMEWKNGPESLPAGAQISEVSGSPKAKGPFVMRLKFPANYKIPAHWHSQDENVTVIEGTMNMGMGDKLDEAYSHSLPVGSFAKMPAKMKHFAFTKDQGAIVQIHGMGPFDITYVDSKDDPRKKK